MPRLCKKYAIDVEIRDKGVCCHTSQILVVFDQVFPIKCTLPVCKTLTWNEEFFTSHLYAANKMRVVGEQHIQ
jgi:hypothetical protein